MNVAGDLLQSIAGGIAGLVGGAIAALGAAFASVVHALQSVLPGALLPIVAAAAAITFLWWLFRH
jgi:hypothetical protein